MNESVFVTQAQLRKYARSAVVGFVGLLAAVTFVLGTKPDVQAQRTAFISACENENILHAQSNITALVSFKILSLSGQQSRRARAVLHPEAGKLRITGLTDCEEATDNPRSYVYPAANEIGDPATGVVNPDVQTIVAESRRLLRETND